MLRKSKGDKNMKDLRNELIATLKSENQTLKELCNVYRTQNNVMPVQEQNHQEEINKKSGLDVGDIIKCEFKNGETYDIQLADKNGILVFVDAICELPFDDKENWQECTNKYDECTLKKYLEKWWEENAPELLKSNYRIDLLESDQVVGDNPLEIFKNWHNRVKGFKGSDHSTWWWTKSPTPWNAYGVRTIYPSGVLDYDNAYSSRGVVPACVPITESKQSTSANELERGQTHE